MIKVNAMGDACPMPVIKTKKAMEALLGPEVIEVLVDNEIAVQNVSKLAVSSGGTVTTETIGEKEYKVLISAAGAAVNATEQPAKISTQEAEKKMVVVIASDRMGAGNDELGKVLLKGFIFAITQLSELPKAILFYNGGAVLTCEGSDSLEDLMGLEEQGVDIMTCGTCLDYYQLKEKLAVGTVTNMYSIVETIAGADNIIRP